MRQLFLLMMLAFALGCNQAPVEERMVPAAKPTAEMRLEPTATVTPLPTAKVTPEVAPSAGDLVSSGTVMIFAAASTTDAIGEIIAQWSDAPAGVQIKTNFAGSSTLAQQINAGAGADIFLSANAKWMDAVAAQAAPPERIDLLGNRLVAIVPADSLLQMTEPAELTQPGVTRLALGDPGAVPAGLYAKAALEKLGLWDGLKGRVVSANDVREAMMYVERGEAEAGVVYATDAAVTNKVKIAFDFDPALTAPIVYPIARLTETEAAKRLFAYLTSPQAREIFIKHGFLSLTAPPAVPTPQP